SRPCRARARLWRAGALPRATYLLRRKSGYQVRSWDFLFAQFRMHGCFTVLPELLLAASAVRQLAFVLHGGLGLIGPDNTGDHRMTHDVHVLEADDRNAFHALEDLQGLDETGFDAARQIDLARVAGHDHAAVFSKARQEHLHL